jgi:hypothetical protein
MYYSEGPLNHLLDVFSIKCYSVSLVSKSDAPTIVLGCEVLDNLPHDKVRAKSRRRLEQAEIRYTKRGEPEEIFVPLVDPLLAKIIKTVPSYVRNYPTWIPSVACGVLHHLARQRPNLGLVFADFDWLPAPDLLVLGDDSSSSETTEEERLSAWAEGEPIVTDMTGIDHECYLQAPPHCDILFPTDFETLASFVKRTARKDQVVTVEKQAEFLERYGPEHIRATKSWLTGHTPLLHDFTNCSVLTVSTNQNVPKQ